MGYRSEVKYVISFKDEEQRDLFCELVKQKGDEEMTKAVEELDKRERYLVASFDHVKWYPEYPDVKSHHALMAFSRVVFEDDAGWRFVRIGEEDNDVEVFSDDPNDELWDVIYPVRAIELKI